MSDKLNKTVGSKPTAEPSRTSLPQLRANISSEDLFPPVDDPEKINKKPKQIPPKAATLLGSIQSRISTLASHLSDPYVQSQVVQPIPGTSYGTLTYPAVDKQRTRSDSE